MVPPLPCLACVFRHAGTVPAKRPRREDRAIPLPFRYLMRLGIAGGGAYSVT